ncbi:hypothetical protein COV16_06730 [Candidatus Woesearchaeota archaeon CG10_big_fil_rev_8_21_14_0_10_34_8]|nr:MAG: hypothetical protein COV16_06730 [Candidatus Woesearchaeota archaeon CG10_big_fil_rev_8_21_14_0_10_34_8]
MPKKHNHANITVVALIAIIAIAILTLASQNKIDFSSNNLIGAAVLKNRCESTPETLVILGSNDDHVYGLDAETGCIQWKTDLEGDVRAKPIISDGLIFIGTTGSELFALSMEDGTEQWSTDLSDDMYGAVALDDDYIYGADTSGSVSAYSKSSGSEEWSYDVHFSKQDAVYDEGYVFVVEEYLHSGNLVAVNTETGEHIWTFNADSMIYTAPLVDDDAIYVPSGENKLYRLYKEYGVLQSTFETEKGIRSTPVIDKENNVLYFGADDGYFYALQINNDATMELKCKYYVGNEIVSQPEIGENIVYVTAYDKKVYAMNKENCYPVWSYATNKKIYAGATLYNDILYVPSGDHNLYALNAETGKELWNFETSGVLYGEVSIAPFTEIEITIEESETSTGRFTGDTSELMTEANSLDDDVKDLLDDIEVLYEKLDDVGGNTTIESTIEDLETTIEEYIESLDTEIDALMSILSAVETDDEYTSAVASMEELETEIDEFVSSVESQIEDIELDISCMENPEDDECQD